MPRGRIGRGGGGPAIGVDTMPRPLGGYKLYRSAETLRLDPESGRRDPLNPDLSHIVPSLISEDDLKACVGRLNEVVLDFDVRTVLRVLVGREGTLRLLKNLISDSRSGWSRLKELLAAGALTQQEYEGKRDEIMEEVGL